MSLLLLFSQGTEAPPTPPTPPTGVSGGTSGPMGPGFFIFFRNKGGSKSVLVSYPRQDRKKEEEEILLFLKTILTKGLI